FRWKLHSQGAGSWATLALSTSPTALGSTGLAIKWSTATTGPDEASNKFTLVPMGVAPPGEWALNKIVANTDSPVALYIYSRPTGPDDPTFWEWNFTAPARAYGALSSYSN